MIGELPQITGELWTAGQRKAHSLHEVSYRACFKPQLPAYFIDQFSSPGDLVYDPFSGRGTTALQAALMGRRPLANDANPLSRLLLMPRLRPPLHREIDARLSEISVFLARHRSFCTFPEMDLSMFYHPDTLTDLMGLKSYFHTRRADGLFDLVDEWIQMVATTRLSGHSTYFFSGYTLPPNQAISAERQAALNVRYGRTPPPRDVIAIIQKKSRDLLRSPFDRDEFLKVTAEAQCFIGPADETPEIPSDFITLSISSPPFLNIVDYRRDNWLRLWFNGLNAEVQGAALTVTSRLDEWEQAMRGVLKEVYRITKPGGHFAFEVGEVRRGTVKLDEVILPLGEAAGWKPVRLYYNVQRFTKTAHIWGVSNHTGGTNTNRIVLFQKP